MQIIVVKHVMITVLHVSKKMSAQAVPQKSIQFILLVLVLEYVVIVNNHVEHVQEVNQVAFLVFQDIIYHNLEYAQNVKKDVMTVTM